MTQSNFPRYKRIEEGGIHEISQLVKVVEELKTKAAMVKSGICSFSEADTFAYRVLAKNGYFGDIKTVVGQIWVDRHDVRWRIVEQTGKHLLLSQALLIVGGRTMRIKHSTLARKYMRLS